MTVKIPKRFLEVSTWKGQADPEYMDSLRLAYAKAIIEMSRSEERTRTNGPGQ